MKPGNNLNIGLIILLAFLTGVTLTNLSQIDSLQASVNELEATIAAINANHQNPRGGLAGVNQTLLLGELLNTVNTSGLNPDGMRFITDFIHLHLGNLPTNDEIVELIRILKDIAKKSSGSSSTFPDFITKYLSNNNGGGGGAPAVT